MIATAFKSPPLFLILIFLAACATPAAPRALPPDSAPPKAAASTPAPVSAPSQAVPSEVVRTLVTALPTVDCGYPSCEPPGSEGKPAQTAEAARVPGDSGAPKGYPPPGDTRQASPTPFAKSTRVNILPAMTATATTASSTTATAAAVPAQAIAYSDCARTPGLPGCAADAVPIASRLAFLDGLAPRLIGLDLQTGAGWQAPLTGEAGWLQWSPDGKELLAALPGDLFVVFNDSGIQAETFSSETTPAWQPDGQLTLNGAVRAANGWTASLVRARETVWDLHFKRGQEEERILPLDDLSADSFYVLRAWIPGTQKLLLQTYTASGSALLSGGRLLVADTLAATLTPYEINAPLDREAFAFRPISAEDDAAPQVAILTSGMGGPEGGLRLVLLDFASNQLRYPLPEGVTPTGLAWSPDGARLAVSIGPLAPNASDEAKRAFPAPGIYLLDPQSGAVETLVQSPTSAVDGWPQWSADGQTLLYARTLPQQNGGKGVEIRARQLPSGQDWLLIQGLPAPATAAGRPAWNRIIAIGRK